MTEQHTQLGSGGRALASDLNKRPAAT